MTTTIAVAAIANPARLLRRSASGDDGAGEDDCALEPGGESLAGALRVATFTMGESCSEELAVALLSLVCCSLLSNCLPNFSELIP
jgi:hypothetical protein